MYRPFMSQGRKRARANAEAAPKAATVKSNAAVLRAAVDSSYSAGANTGTVSNVLNSLEEEEVLIAPKQRSVQSRSYKEREQWFQKHGKTVELLLQDSTTFQWPVCSPLEILETMCARVPSHEALVKSAVSIGEDVCILLYTDELVPGNVLAPDPRRRTWSVYFTLQKFDVCTTCSDCWYCCAVLRNSIKDKVESGLSGVMRSLLESWQPEMRGRVFSFSDGSQQFMRLRIAAVIADEAALCSFMGVKGATGRKPCWLCADLVFNHAKTALGAGGWTARKRILGFSIILVILAPGPLRSMARSRRTRHPEVLARDRCRPLGSSRFLGEQQRNGCLQT